MYDLGRLRVLRELSHRGTLAAVAEALAYSPSTISQQLTQLEKEVGVALLEPHGRGVRLTPQALVLAGHVERILQVLDEAEADVAASLTTLTGTIRIAAFQSAMSAYVPALVESLSTAHPGLRVEASQLEPEVAIPRLRARDLDLVLTERYPGDAAPWPGDLDAAPLADDPLLLVVPAATPRTRRSLADFAEAQWVLEPAGTTSRQWAESVCRAAGFLPDVRFEATDLRLHSISSPAAAVWRSSPPWPSPPGCLTAAALSPCPPPLTGGSRRWCAKAAPPTGPSSRCETPWRDSRDEFARQVFRRDLGG